MVGQWTALLSSVLYSLSYLLLHVAQRRGETCDNGVLPVLCLSSLVLLAASGVRISLEPSAWVWPWPHIGFMALSGLCGTFLGRTALFASMVRLGATRSVVVKSLSPIVTIMTAVVFLHEPLKIEEWLGIFMMLSGVGLLLVERSRRDTRAVFRTRVLEGVVLGLAAAVFEGVGHTWRKLGMDAGDALWAAAIDLTVAAAAYVAYLAGKGRLRAYTRFYVSVRSPYTLASSITSAAAVLTFYAAVDFAPVSVVATIVGIQPVVLVILSSLWFRSLEDKTWLTFVYTPLTVLGVWMVVRGG
ncbi:DMT family transporter [Alicyclobacillus kakegawensis]|uniref:DMT family transporter n=1 Tax=Alicyclobacillus kakegawensis TaxID=392012 RepID=UPI00082C7966|nr:DMT family transporter [Alicyclobacillus kakegawensis]